MSTEAILIEIERESGKCVALAGRSAKCNYELKSGLPRNVFLYLGGVSADALAQRTPTTPDPMDCSREEAVDAADAAVVSVGAGSCASVDGGEKKDESLRIGPHWPICGDGL
jgi:hypothetical protein